MDNFTRAMFGAASPELEKAMRVGLPAYHPIRWWESDHDGAGDGAAA